MTVLFFQLEENEQLLPPLDDFNAAQMVIEDLVHQKGKR